MKRHLSLLMLIARSSIFKYIELLLAMAAVQLLLFYLRLYRYGAQGLEKLFRESGVAWAFGACFLILCLLLCLTGCEFGSKQGYTLRRLRLSERSIYFWQAGYNCACFLMFWGVQLLITLLLGILYIDRLPPDGLSGQTLLLAYYRNSFLHSLLPLDESSRYLRNALLIIALGFSTALFPFRQRRGRIGLEALAMAAAAVMMFRDEMGAFGSDILLMVLAGFIITICLVRVLGKGYDYEA